VRVGLEARLYDVGLTDDTPKVIGTPSRIPFSSRPSRFGRGKGRFESGPAMFWRTSKLDRRFIFVAGETMGVTNAEGGEVDVDAMLKSSDSSGAYGRGPTRMMFSRVCS